MHLNILYRIGKTTRCAYFIYCNYKDDRYYNYKSKTLLCHNQPIVSGCGNITKLLFFCFCPAPNQLRPFLFSLKCSQPGIRDTQSQIKS